MAQEPIQYAALIPAESERATLAQLLRHAASTPGFTPINPYDAHLTVGFNREGFDHDALLMLKDIRNVELKSPVAQGFQRKQGNLHLIYAPNTKQIAVAIEFPSHQVNELKAKLKHAFDGRLSLSHMTIGVLDAQALGIDPSQLETLAALKDYDTMQAQLDGAFSAFLESEAGAPLKQLSRAPLSLTMEKVIASSHRACSLDITAPAQPILQRENALDKVHPSLFKTPARAVSSWVSRVLDAPKETGVAVSAGR